jgi:hypothetical protein
MKSPRVMFAEIGILEGQGIVKTLKGNSRENIE